MNRIFFLSGLKVSRLMQIHGLTSLDFAQKLNRTRQASYDIQKREIIKDADAYKILEALGFLLKEVEDMDNKGFFNSTTSSVEVIEKMNFTDLMN